MRAETPAGPGGTGPAKKIVEGIFSMEVSRAYSTLILHQENSFQDLLQAVETPGS
jgi:hypothetical protein